MCPPTIIDLIQLSIPVATLTVVTYLMHRQNKVDAGLERLEKLNDETAKRYYLACEKKKVQEGSTSK